MTTAVVVGSGPNGLAAAVTLARAGVQVRVLEAAATIGGGTRTSELTLPGLLHDHCSAVHPMGVGSPFMRAADLEKYGVTWRWPEVDLSHPLGEGRAGAMVWSLAETERLLGVDGRSWRRLFEPLSADFDDLAVDLMRPLVHLPRHPFKLARFGLRALEPAAVVARRWSTPEARALFGGVAAHAFRPLHRPTSAAVGLMLITVGHRYGWPVAEGGSRTITDALARIVVEHGGVIETSSPVTDLRDVSADVVLLDLAPQGVIDIAGDRLPGRVRRAYAAYRHGPGAFKVDLAVDGGIPWRDEHSPRAGTVHLGGTFEEVAHAELEVSRGRMPERPFVLLGQQYLADPTRSHGDQHPVWAYAHVPHGYPGDATEQVIGQIERFAPGVRERILDIKTTRATAWPAYNANFIGGDIATGANTERQVAFRPRVTLRPYETGIPGVYICSAATPPGGGVHGMGGSNAANAALEALRRAG
ncbi:MAG: NAD(P)/FAD-dependent oxidoreductase [Nocardioides sp.]